MKTHIPRPLKEIALVFTILIVLSALCGLWAYVLLFFVELLFGQLDQDGIAFHLILMSGIISLVLIALFILKIISRKSGSI